MTIKPSEPEPTQYLEVTYIHNPVRAIKLARTWLDHEVTMEKALAASALLSKQTALQVCIHCQHEIFPEKPHDYCVAFLTDVDWTPLTPEEQNSIDAMAQDSDDYGREEDESDRYDDYEKDPLAVDVEKTGGYYDPQPNPLNTQHYHALKNRGLI